MLRRGATLLSLLILLATSIASCTAGTAAGDGEIILATTTSTQDSGLLDVLVPAFESESGIVVKVIAVGTGQALQMGEEGNADVLLVHAPESEIVLIENGSAVERRLVMHNDFLLAGPPADPAGIRGLATAAEALAQIAAAGSTFVSRGDESGTHKKELSLWAASGQVPAGAWYLESGQGMGATLRVASERAGYTLTDRATYLSLRDTLALEPLVEGESGLLNIYHAMLVNPEKWPRVNAAGARAFLDFLTSDEGQTMIGEFGTAEFGQPLFFPDAGKLEAELGLDGG
jgi:tungstate transport system substrate-binding protein